MKIAFRMCCAMSVLLGPVASAQDAERGAVPLKQAKIIIEHNATDADTGFQGFIDSEGWKELTIRNPLGDDVLRFEAQARLRQLGVTELFFETVEPANAKVPIDQLLARMPAGTYRISGPAGGPDAGKTTVGRARLTHVVPKGPVLAAPADGSTVAAGAVTFDWEPVTQTIFNQPVSVIAYQLIVEKVQAPHPNMIGKRGSLSMYVGPAITAMTVPAAFFEAGSHYSWEVLAIEPSGNQTLSSAEFTTP